MARPGAFKSEKRKKELTRQKKQEKKRLRRLEKDAAPEGVPAENDTTEDAITEETEGPKTVEENE